MIKNITEHIAKLNKNDYNTNNLHYVTITNKIPWASFSTFISENKLLNQDIIDQMSAQLSSSKAPTTRVQKKIEVIYSNPIIDNIRLIWNGFMTNNTANIVAETSKYNNFAIEDLKVLADDFLGMCHNRIDNVDVHMEYLKIMTRNRFWYVKVNDEVAVSFRDLILTKLEETYKTILECINDMDENFRINKSSSDDNTNNYLKKKHILVDAFKIICSCYNNNILSQEVMIGVFDDLRNEHSKKHNDSTIYLEIIILIWKNISANIKANNNEYYTNTMLWFNKEQYLTENSRMNIMLGTVLSSSDIAASNEDFADKTFYDVENMLINCETDEEVIRFSNNNKTHFNLYLVKYLLDAVVNNEEHLRRMVDALCVCVGGIEHFKRIINDTIENDDIQCDFPLYGPRALEFLDSL